MSSFTSQDPSKDQSDAIARDNEEEEQARIRRGTVSPELRNEITMRSCQGRKAVSLRYAAQRDFSRSQSEASIFRPVKEEETIFPHQEPIDNPSNTLWNSGYTQLSRVKSTSSAIGGLNDDPFRAGWRRNEPGPYWEQEHELEPDRRQMMDKIDETDGFELGDDEELDDSGPESTQLQDLNSSFSIPDLDANSSQAEDTLGDLPSPDLFFNNSSSVPRQFSKTKSMPVNGSFSSRKPFDDTFMRMNEPF